MAIEEGFIPFLSTIMSILQQASEVTIDEYADEEFVEYINSLRESILEAYTGIIQVVSDHDNLNIELNVF